MKMQGHADVVWIEDDCRLVDSESYERTYQSGTSNHPRPGAYYVARWPADAQNPSFLDERLSFDGPYPSRRMAEAACWNRG